MPLTHMVNHQRREMYATAVGAITIDDIRTHLTEERRDGGLSYPELIEASGATVAFSTEGVLNTVEILRALSLEGTLGPTAIVVGNEAAYGMVRMLETHLDGICQVRPFRTLEEAQSWLSNIPALS